MALAYAKLKIEIREISLRNRPESLYEASSKGTVPVLITSDNKSSGLTLINSPFLAIVNGDLE